MALLAVQDVPETGVGDVTFVAATGTGDSAPFGGNHVLIVKNTDLAVRTVTVSSPDIEPSLRIADIVRTVPASTGIALIPLLGRLVGATATIAYSAVSGVTVAVVKLAE